MSWKSIAAIIFAGAALPSAALAQDSGKAGDPGPKKRIRQAVNLRVEEWFDEERADGVTYAKHPYALVAPNFTYQGACHWRRRERDRSSPFAFYRDEDQEEEQDDRDRPPDLTTTPRSPGISFRDAAGGVKYQFGTSFRTPTIAARSPTDGLAIDFDKVDAQGAPGLFLSTTLAFGNLLGLGDVEVTFFADYLSGTFDRIDSVTRLVDDGTGRGVQIPLTDTYHLEGDFWLMEVGLAPILKRFATEDGSLSAEISLALGFYYGRLANLAVRRAGSVVESFSLPDESLLGFFAGPTIHASYRIGGNFRVGAFGEFWRLMGNLDAWTGLAGVEVRINF